MFSYIVSNIRERYSREELSQRYGVNLPNYGEKLNTFKNESAENIIDGHFYQIINGKKFSKEKGEKAKVNILEDGELLHFESRVGWLAKLIAMLLAFINGIKMKIYNFFMGLIPDIPENLKGLVKMIIFLILLPFTIIGLIFLLLRKALNAPGGIFGIIISLIISVFIFFFMVILEFIGVLLAPVLNKIADSMIDKPIIKKMVIGSFVFDNSFSQGILLENSMVENISFETAKNLLGKEKLYVIAKEGNIEASFIDKILTFMLPNYFVNRRTVFVTDLENKSHFENIYKQ